MPNARFSPHFPIRTLPIHLFYHAVIGIYPSLRRYASLARSLITITNSKQPNPIQSNAKLKPCPLPNTQDLKRAKNEMR